MLSSCCSRCQYPLPLHASIAPAATWGQKNVQNLLVAILSFAAASLRPWLALHICTRELLSDASLLPGVGLQDEQSAQEDGRAIQGGGDPVHVLGRGREPRGDRGGRGCIGHCQCVGCRGRIPGPHQPSPDPAPSPLYIGTTELGVPSACRTTLFSRPFSSLPCRVTQFPDVLAPSSATLETRWNPLLSLSLCV